MAIQETCSLDFDRLLEDQRSTAAAAAVVRDKSGRMK